MVEVENPITKEKVRFYLDPALKRNLDKLKIKLQKKDQDVVIIIDGNEGSGKSVLAMQICKYMDPTFCLDDVCMNATEFKNAVMGAVNHKALDYDEAFTGLSSRSSLSQVNRMLVSLMMQMRQKNLFVVVALPSIFLLDRYVSMFRSSALISIYQSRGRHLFFVFNRKAKKILLLEGKKTMSYAPTIKKLHLDFKGEFRGNYVMDEQAYRDKKRKALEETEEYELDKGKVVRDKMIYLLHKEFDLVPRRIEELFEKHNISLKQRQIYLIIKKVEKEVEKKYGKKENYEEKTSKEKTEKANEEIN